VAQEKRTKSKGVQVISKPAPAEDIAVQRTSSGIESNGLGRLLTINEVADLLGVPVATIYRWRHVGDGPPGYRIGRHVRFRRVDVEAWIESRADARTAR
jgi:excisionase family DNA binding protein